MWPVLLTDGYVGIRKRPFVSPSGKRAKNDLAISPASAALVITGAIAEHDGRRRRIRQQSVLDQILTLVSDYFKTETWSKVGI